MYACVHIYITDIHMLYKHDTKATLEPWEGFIKALQLQPCDPCTSGFHCPLVLADSVGSHAVHLLFHGSKLPS